jgi:hypothetical protein
MDSLSCRTYAEELVEILYSMCPRSHFKQDAQEHIMRLAEYTVCFHAGCTERGSPGWWQSTGKAYYTGRVQELIDTELDCSGGRNSIGCRDLQAAVNRYANKVKRRLARLQSRLKKGAAKVGGEGEAEPLQLLLGCPFTAER